MQGNIENKRTEKLATTNRDYCSADVRGLTSKASVLQMREELAEEDVGGRLLGAGGNRKVHKGPPSDGLLPT